MEATKYGAEKESSADSFLIAKGCFIPKKGDLSSIKDFRTISLPNVERKLFFVILAKTVTQILINIKYIETSV